MKFSIKKQALMLIALCAIMPAFGMQPEEDLEMNLHQAAEERDMARCEKLIRASTNVDEKKMARLTSLYLVAIENHAKAKMYGYTNARVCFLQLAADDMLTKMCCRLIIANPNTLNPNTLICPDGIPFTPAGIACHRNNIEVVKTFLTTPLHSEYKKFKAARCGLIALRFAQPKLHSDMRLFIDQTIINSFANDHMNRIKKMLASTASQLAQKTVWDIGSVDFLRLRNFLGMIAPVKKVINLEITGTIMKKEYINEVAWRKILKFLKQCKGVYIGRECRCKNFIEAIYWMSRTGAQWRELHDKYGNWNSIFKRFNAWSKKNVWSKLLQFCIEEPDLEYVMIDATVVRAHACAAGYGEQKTEGLGRSSGGFSTKIHAKVDALGNPLQFIITSGQTSDVTQAKSLLQDLVNSHVIADKAYGSNEVREHIKSLKSIDVIPSKTNSLSPIDYDKHIYKERHVIECFFSKIKYFRRVFSRFDKSARNYTAFLSFVGVLVWLR